MKVLNCNDLDGGLAFPRSWIGLALLSGFLVNVAGFCIGMPLRTTLVAWIIGLLVASLAFILRKAMSQDEVWPRFYPLMFAILAASPRTSTEDMVKFTGAAYLLWFALILCQRAIPMLQRPDPGARPPLWDAEVDS
jgi:hypothetical protein